MKNIGNIFTKIQFNHYIGKKYEGQQSGNYRVKGQFDAKYNTGFCDFGISD
ncbi:hypothetical protein [Eubacterium sp.]|uniref:hypothetical protein n=1 Tax=Eubacterium sp. TaxID=142586 RepID=UPI0026714073|nr:hypothetical protein [uncultured Eubacterium sp.]MBS5652425.1 hypothetical protein [Eubacterium sp.]